jgi:hypothetical protein
MIRLFARNYHHPLIKPAPLVLIKTMMGVSHAKRVAKSAKMMGDVRGNAFVENVILKINASTIALKGRSMTRNPNNAKISNVSRAHTWIRIPKSANLARKIALSALIPQLAKNAIQDSSGTASPKIRLSASRIAASSGLTMATRTNVISAQRVA